MWDVCQVRAEKGFDERDAVRGQEAKEPLVYRIRIVCQEGAIVRNGIDIDRCENVGNVEMGEIVYAYGASLITLDWSISIYESPAFLRVFRPRKMPELLMPSPWNCSPMQTDVSTPPASSATELPGGGYLS